MTDPFDSPSRKITRAYRHITDVEDAVEAFDNSDAYANVVEPHPNGTHNIHKIVLAKPFPKGIEEIIADACNCLRSALDQTGYAIAVASGVSNPKRAYFPFASSAAEIENTIKGRCSDLPPEIVALARTFKPYKGGDDFLWAVNDVANADKHRRLITISPQMDRMSGTEISARGHVPMPPRWDSVKNEMVYAVARRGHPFKAKFNVRFYVAFNEIEPIRGCPVDLGIVQMGDTVNKIVRAMKAEAIRLGIVK